MGKLLGGLQTGSGLIHGGTVGGPTNWVMIDSWGNSWGAYKLGHD